LLAVQRPIEGENILGVQIGLVEKAKNKNLPLSVYFIYHPHSVLCTQHKQVWDWGVEVPISKLWPSSKSRQIPKGKSR
jgi:hypothetical protein